MSEEVEQFSPSKKRWMKDLESLRPDLFFPEGWSQVERETALEELKPENTRRQMILCIPMVCRGPKCPIKDSCPLFAKDIHPLGKTCHPPGEMIMTTRHGEVAIEDLDQDIHKLYGWDRKISAIRPGRRQPGFKFNRVSRHYEGDLITLSTGSGASQRVTHDHISAVSFNENALDKFVVYLMRKGDFWRVGKTKLAATTKKSDYGHKAYLAFPVRGNREEADEMWILGVYDANTEALLAEDYVSVTYGITQLSFADSLEKYGSKYNGLYRWATKDQMELHHKRVQQDISHYAFVLSEFGRDIDYPIWRRAGPVAPELGPYVNYPFFTRACNIIPEVMSVPVFSDEINNKQQNYFRRSPWEPVFIDRQPYTGQVYSLDVDMHKTYFAGRIATHNCPIELNLVTQFMQEYMDELNVDPDNLNEVALIRDLVDQEIQYIRKTKVLASENFIVENVVGVDHQGNPIMRKELHQAIELEDKLHRRKRDLRNQLLATREARAKAGQVSTLDTAQNIANIIEEVAKRRAERERELLRKAGKEVVDEYIVEAEIIEDE